MAGILGQILGGMVAGNLGRRGPGAGGGSMVLNGLLVALAAKAAQHYMSQRSQGESSEAPDRRQGQPELGGLGGLGGLAAGGGLGGLLGGLGGAGALSALLGQLRRNGMSQEVDSWVQPGPNAPVAPDRLAAGLGEETVDALSEETGMPRGALLTELAETLPHAVDDLTPERVEPSDSQLQRIIDKN